MGEQNRVHGGRGPRDSVVREGVWNRRAIPVGRLLEGDGYSIYMTIKKRHGPYSKVQAALTAFFGGRRRRGRSHP